MEAIFKRRSIRKFQETPVPAKLTEKILRAGMAAPSAGDSREWEFILFEDAGKKAGIMEASEYAFPLKTAPLCILVCANLKEAVYEEHWEQDCSAAMENMLLEATYLGLGNIWLGIYPHKNRVDTVRELFSLPEHVIPMGLFAAGYAAKEKPPIDRYMEDRVHWESYGEHWEKPSRND